MASTAGTARYVLGLDIGGTKLAVGLCTPAGEVVSWQRAPTRPEEGPDAVIARLIGLARRAVAEAGTPWDRVLAVGVGCGGPLDPRSGMVLNPVFLKDWVNVPLTRILEEALGRPAFLDNDATAAALGEHQFGAGRGSDHMVYMTISTGIGGGIILGGRVWPGQSDNAGEIGHMSVNYNGRLCGCGRRGCLEAYASGTAIGQRAREAVLAGEPSAMAGLAGDVDAITAETVIAAVQQGDPLAARLWDETMHILGTGIANVIHILNPQLVVLGGGVTNAGSLLFVPVRRVALSQLFEPHARVVRIEPAALGSRVGVLGAAAVALEGLRQRSAGVRSDA